MLARQTYFRLYFHSARKITNCLPPNPNYKLSKTCSWDMRKTIAGGSQPDIGKHQKSSPGGWRDDEKLKRTNDSEPCFFLAKRAVNSIAEICCHNST